MPRVSDQHRLDRQDEILAAALAAFRRKGFQATSMAEIIAESGLSAGAIYGYFGSKSDIILAVATRVVGARIADLEDLAKLDPLPEPAEVARILLDGLVGSIGQPAVLIQVWGEAATDPALRALCSDIFTQLRNALASYLARWNHAEHGMSEAEARRAASAQAPLFVSAVQGFVLQDTLFTDFDREEYLAKSLEYLPR